MSGDRGARILAAAEKYAGTPYALPPDGVHTLDCSLFVLYVYRDAGYAFPPGVRTAEQIRQACDPIGWSDVQPGDLLFMEQTYEAGGQPGPDGKIASHLGISFGAGSGKMWDAVQAAGRDGVGVTNIRTAYWQGHMLSAGRYAPATTPPPQPGTGNFVVSGTGGIGLRVRSAPNTTAAVLGTLPEGTRVEGDEHAWRKVNGNGLEGWAANTFLVPTELPGPIPPPPSTDLQDCIDVSNYQAADLSAIIAQYQPSHVVVRASTESSRHREIARQQIRTASAAGCSVSAYIWAYFDLSPAEHTANAMSVMDGLPVERYWIDCEDVCPPGRLEDWLSRSVAMIEARGKQSGVYTSRGWWQAHGNSRGFTRLPLWGAQWDEVPTLESVAMYGGWGRAHGKQYSTTGETLDRNVFDGSVC